MFKGLGLYLLLTYLTVIAGIFGTSAMAVYLFFVNSLYNQLDSRLLTLAQSAAPSLTAVKQEGESHLQRREEIPWQDLFRRNQQSLSWFSADGEKLATQGTIQVDLPVREGILTLKRQQIRTFTIPVYLETQDGGELTLEGYIRASESTQEIDDVVTKLRWGFALGGVVALTLSGVGSIWLVQQSLRPTRQSFQQLQQFTADASHELRSPLTAIKTSVEVILKHPERIHPKDTKKLSAIASATNQMTRLVEDLLFLARTDAAVATSETVMLPVSLTGVLQQLTNLLEPVAQSRGLILKTYWANAITVIGDEAKLTRLLGNLIDNAIQYTPPGGTITVSLTRSTKFAFVNVEDTGIGIAADRIQYIFQRLWRTDRARSYRSNGLGLGLAIAKAIAQQHDGEIIATSVIGKGSCFRVKLPLKGATDHSRALKRSQPQTS